MKIKDGFVLRQVADSWMAVPVGSMAGKIHGLIALNDTGAEIWKILERNRTEEEVVELLSEIYDADRDELREQALAFIRDLREKEILDL